MKPRENFGLFCINFVGGKPKKIYIQRRRLIDPRFLGQVGLFNKRCFILRHEILSWDCKLLFVERTIFINFTGLWFCILKYEQTNVENLSKKSYFEFSCVCIFFFEEMTSQEEAISLFTASTIFHTFEISRISTLFHVMERWKMSGVVHMAIVTLVSWHPRKKHHIYFEVSEVLSSFTPIYFVEYKAQFNCRGGTFLLTQGR